MVREDQRLFAEGLENCDRREPQCGVIIRHRKSRDSKNDTTTLVVYSPRVVMQIVSAAKNAVITAELVWLFMRPSMRVTESCSRRFCQIVDLRKFCRRFLKRAAVQRPPRTR